MCPQAFLRQAWSDFGQTWHKHCNWWHTRAPHFILQSDQRWLPGRLVAVLVVHKYGLVLSHQTAKLLTQWGLWHSMSFFTCFKIVYLKKDHLRQCINRWHVPSFFLHSKTQFLLRHGKCFLFLWNIWKIGLELFSFSSVQDCLLLSINPLRLPSSRLHGTSIFEGKQLG